MTLNPRLLWHRGTIALFTYSYDFELVLAKKPVIFLCTLSLSQLGHLIFGFSSYSLIVRKIEKSFWQSLQSYSYAGIMTSFKTISYCLHDINTSYHRLTLVPQFQAMTCLNLHSLILWFDLQCRFWQETICFLICFSIAIKVCNTIFN